MNCFPTHDHDLQNRPIDPARYARVLEAAGFGEISVMTEKETSSRRPDEAAFFLYATCRSPR
jgi:hypothetical protein